jgi:cobalt-precorrin-7 (C5)-methyltransferase
MIYVVGMGPGHIDFVTPEATKIIQTVDAIIAFGRISKTAQLIREDISIAKTVSEIESQITKQNQLNIAILASGDPCFFGIAKYLKSKNIIIDRIIPGLSSFQYMAAKLGINWQEAAFFTCHGRHLDLHQVMQKKLSILLTDKNTPPDKISQWLHSEGAEGKIWVGSDLSYPNESVIERNIGEPLNIHSELIVIFIQIVSITI